MSTLSETLNALAAQLNLDASELAVYASEDTIGGYHTDAAQAKWTVGSIWGVEGQVLYALTRYLLPEHVAEFGVNAGCSATHFLAALSRNNRGGLESVDPWEGAGQHVPEGLRSHWQMHYARGLDWLDAQPDQSFDILFEDMIHGWEATRDWWLVAQRKVAPGGLLISHDATHPTVGVEVVRGIHEAGLTAALYSIEPSDCGLAIWRAVGAPETSMTKTMTITHIDDEGNRTVIASVPPEPAKVEPAKPAPKKRTPAKKPAVRKTAAKK